MGDLFFGSEAQQALLKRGQEMFTLTKDDPRLTYYGRTVGFADHTPHSHAIVEALAALQGAAHYGCVKDADVGPLTVSLAGRGYSTTHFVRWVATNATFELAEQTLADNALPSDVTAITLSPDSPHTDLEKLAKVALSCGVLPPAGAVLRGIARPAVSLLAVDESGNPVSCAGSSAICHPDHPRFGGQAWWGMLATDPGRRGEKLALILGAMAILQMRDRFGFQGFFTGVQPGNGPSEAVCRKMGLTPDGTSVVTVVDPVAMPGGALTK